MDADVAKLVDALDLGSSDESRGGSSPFIRTKKGVAQRAAPFLVWDENLNPLGFTKQSGGLFGAERGLPSAVRRRSRRIKTRKKRVFTIPFIRPKLQIDYSK